ncbi:MAG: hypothetical protein D6828_04160, partial [Nitrospirae bacterium]
TRFKVGDRVTMARTKDGIVLAKAVAGAERRETDMTSIEQGYAKRVHNEYSFRGYTKYYNPETGKEEPVYGTFNFRPSDGKIISGNISNLVNSEVMGDLTIQDGNEKITVPGVLSGKIGMDGRMIYNFKAVSEREVVRGGEGHDDFVSKQYVNPKDGNVVFDRSQGGQDTAWYHRYTMDLRKGAEFSLLGGFIDYTFTQDLNNLSENELKAIMYGGSAKLGIDAGFKAGFGLQRIFRANGWLPKIGK